MACKRCKGNNGMGCIKCVRGNVARGCKFHAIARLRCEACMRKLTASQGK